MTYTWSDEQRRGLTFGSTVEFEGRREPVGRPEDVYPSLRGKYVYLAKRAIAERISDIDPSTLRPPSIEWIRELAMERLGADAEATDEYGDVKVVWNDGLYVFAFTETDDKCRFRAAVAAIVAISNAGFGK